MPYDFTRSVSDPRDIYSQGYGANPNTTAGTIGSALSGLADVFSVGLKVIEKKQTDKRLGDFENEIAPLQQAVAQGRMKPNEAFARTTAIIKSNIDRYPTLADDLRKRSQAIWGVDAGQEIIAEQRRQAETKESQEKLVNDKALSVASEHGAMVMKEDGSGVDYDESIAVGHAIQGWESALEMSDKEMERKEREARVKKLQSGQGDLSYTEQQSIKEGVLGQQVSALSQEHIYAGVKNIPALISKLDPKDAQSIEFAKKALAQSKLQTRQVVIQSLAGRDDLDKKTYDNILSRIDTEYSVYENYSVEQIKVLADLVEASTNGNKVEFARVAPAAKFLMDNAGQGFAAPYINANIMGGSGAGTLDTEAQVLVGHLGRVAAGNPAPDDPAKRDLTIKIIKGSAGGMAAYSNAPDLIPKENLPAYANTSDYLVDQALVSNDPDDYVSAINSVANPGALRAFDNLKKVDPAKAETTARKLLQLSTATVSSNGRRSHGTTTENLSGSELDQTALATGLDLGRSRSFTTQYNAVSGVVEIIGDGRPPKNIMSQATAMNQALKTIVKLKEYGGDTAAGMTDQELKLQLIQSSGMAVKGKTPDQAKADAKSNETETVTVVDEGEDMIDTKVLFHIESGGNPNAVSPKGAKGVGQTMPKTLKDPGFGVRPAADDSDEELERVATDYIKAMENEFGDESTALVAYNWGPGNAKKWLASGAQWSKLPAETQMYVGRYYMEKDKRARKSR